MSALALATWNVHAFVGRDGRLDPERTTRVIRSLGARVVALQEVVSHAAGAAGPDPLGKLARETGMERIEGATMRRGDARYGNVLLTSLPVERALRLDLSVAGREPRGALLAEIAIPGGRLRVVTTHLGLRRGERRRQVARLAAWLGAIPHGRPLALLGDFNDWTPNARQLRPLRALCGPFSRLATFPARRPVLALDRIAAAPPGLLRRVEVVDTPEARSASDHLPLRAELAPVPPGSAPRVGPGPG